MMGVLRPLLFRLHFVSASSNQNQAPQHFATTQWSMIVRAVDKDDSQVARKALTELCQQYWYPLYCFVRSKIRNPDDSEDIVQGFFTQLLEKESIQMADQARGRFRNFLLGSVDNFMKNRHRAAKTIKRGGDVEHVSIDFEKANQRFQFEPIDDMTSEKIFERSWALELIDCCLQKLRQRYEKSGKSELFEALCSSLLGGQARYAEIAETLGQNENAVKVAAHRMRERLGDEIRLEIRNTLNDAENVEAELKLLMGALQD